MINRKHYRVVAAVVCHQGRYLCMQKGKTRFPYTTYKFEFPGGKIEPGETPQEALRRELMEEMDFPVEVGQELVAVDHDYPDFSITLRAFLCSCNSPQFVMNEHVAYRWLDCDTLATLDWAAADVGIVEAVQKLEVG